MSDITREEAIKILKDTLYDERTPNNYIQAVRMGREALENQKIEYCKDCDKWKKGKTENDEDWYSDEGYCSNWRTMTGEKFYCADFEVKENKK